MVNKKILFLVLLVVTCFYSGCISPLERVFSTSNVSGIVKSRYGYKNQSSYTHKYLNASLKALPIIITSGNFKNNGKTFTEIEFKVYNKVKTINYKYIELYTRLCGLDLIVRIKIFNIKCLRNVLINNSSTYNI